MVQSSNPLMDNLPHKDETTLCGQVPQANQMTMDKQKQTTTNQAEPVLNTGYKRVGNQQ